MTNDGHRCHIAADWLARHLASAVHQAEPTRRIEHRRAGDELTHIERSELDTESGLHRFVHDLLTYGATVVENIGTGDDDLRSVAALIGPIEPTNCGDTWAIEATVARSLRSTANGTSPCTPTCRTGRRRPASNCCSHRSPTSPGERPRSSTGTPSPHDSATSTPTRGTFPPARVRSFTLCQPTTLPLGAVKNDPYQEPAGALMTCARHISRHDRSTPC